MTGHQEDSSAIPNDLRWVLVLQMPPMEAELLEAVARFGAR
jgi:hypothetical protein